jgi:transcriptional regulator with XRE-family HTH domain
VTSLDREVRQGLGMHLRRLRQAQSLTLAALAEQVGVTASALSQIERGTSEPSLGTLWRLGRALNASLFDFFAGQEAPTVDVTRAGDRTIVEFERFRYEVMARSAQRGIDLFTLRLEPGDGPVREPIGHAGEEAGVVVEGTMDVVVAGVTHRLGPGDAIWFISGQPHTFVPVGDAPCLSVWADTIPDHAAPGGSRSVFDGWIAGTEAPADATVVARGRSRNGSGAGARERSRDDALAVARALPLDAAYLREVVDRLSSIGSSPLGFRVTGTPQDREAAAYVAGELRGAGLADVAVEEVAVDGWRFEGARLEPAGGPAIEGASLGGAPATPAGGVQGRVVDAGAARRRELDRLDVRGALVLVDWRKGPAGPSDIGLELGLRGAAGMIVTPAEGGPYFQADGALGAFDGHWHAAAPPMMTIRMRDGDALRSRLAAGPLEATMTVRAEVTPGAAGSNVVGYLPGDEPGPIVVGAHHDGWFRAAFDNATGVASLLAIARALAAAGHRPRHRIGFTSRTAEEFGLLDRAVDWCVGAWRQVSVTHPEWGEQAPFHLCLEASGHPDLRVTLVAPTELTAWARATGRAGEAEGWLTSGWRTHAPTTGTEMWPLLVAGVPGVTAFTWETSFERSVYHSPLDTPAIVDFDHLERLTRFYAFLLLDADRDPGGMLDHAARGRHLAKRAEQLGAAGAPLRAAAEAHGAAGGRPAFAAVGRALLGVKADGGTGYPHEQAAADVAALEAALAALGQDDAKGAARQLAKVGDNALALHLSAAAFAQHGERRRRQHDDDSWAARSHLTDSPDLWAELAALRGEPGARKPGPWIGRSLQQHLKRSRADLDRRVDAMARALEPTPRPDPGRSP